MDNIRNSQESQPNERFTNYDGTKMNDKWKHRSEGMKCKICMWFVPKEATRQIEEPKEILGRCRRHAPTMAGYPAVFSSDWCGDHKINENS
jgi:Pyruvate/2-oxoacid:ferredoxin oxidoreductase delta subunit